MKYIAFDVETPNSRNDRMSAIGLAVVEDGVITREFATVVDPETYFHPFNIRLTGITPGMAAEAPTFAELWPVLEPVFSDGVLAAHNAPFDMGVLSKCLRAYGVEWRRYARYCCTVRMGRRCYPRLENHRLNTMCEHLDIPLDHHRAGSDSRACAQLLINYEERGLDIEAFTRVYDLALARTLPGHAIPNR